MEWTRICACVVNLEQLVIILYRENIEIPTNSLADSRMRGSIIHLDPASNEGQIKVYRSDSGIEIVHFMFDDVTLDKRYLSDLQVGHIVNFSLRTQPPEQPDGTTSKRYAIHVSV